MHDTNTPRGNRLARKYDGKSHQFRSGTDDIEHTRQNCIITVFARLPRHLGDCSRRNQNVALIYLALVPYASSVTRVGVHWSDTRGEAIAL